MRFPQRRKDAKKRLSSLLRASPLRSCRNYLEVQLQPKLELPRVESCCRAAEITSVVGALIEGSNVVDKRRGGGFVEAVEEIEAFRNQLQPEALAERQQLCHAQIQLT